jgi:hypothetical protein
VQARGAVVVVVLVLAACSGPTSIGSQSPSPSPKRIFQTIGASPTTTSSTGPASLAHCTAAIPAGDNLVLGTVVGDPVIVVRDIQDPANARNLCTLDAAAQSPQFISATSIAYETPDNQIIKADLASGATTVLASYHSGLGSGQYAVRSDGRSITYLDGNAWHLSDPSGDRVLTTLPAIPGRGVNPDEDDIYLSFSPDGGHVALFQTFHVGGSGETAPDQIRRASDGGLVYSTSGMTMAVWASVPSRLFFRDSTGSVRRWDSSTGVSSMTSLHWIRPRSSPDGRWIAYTFRTTSGLGGIGFYSVQGNSVANTTPPGRSGVRFLTNDLVWYIGEKACSTCIGVPAQPTGVAYIYDIAGGSEVTARLSSVFDAWPRSSG